MLRALLISLLALAIVPAAASAAVVDIQVSPKDGLDFGEAHTVTGKLTGPYGAPLVGRQVELEIRSYPYRGRQFRSVAQALTGLDGRFAFEQEFPRNHQVRVFAPEFGDRSAVEPIYVFPRTSLSFNLVRRNVIRVVQTYRTPTNVKLTAPTLFYVGRAGRRRRRGPRAPRRGPSAAAARSARGASAPPRWCGSRGPGAGASATRAASRTTRAWATRSSAARRSATGSRRPGARAGRRAPS